MKANEGAGSRLPEPVTGTAPGPGAGAKRDGKHHEGFNNAIEDAIAQIEQKDWPKPASYDVVVTFEATVDVENPGGIGEYRATFS